MFRKEEDVEGEDEGRGDEGERRKPIQEDERRFHKEEQSLPRCDFLSFSNEAEKYVGLKTSLYH